MRELAVLRLAVVAAVVVLALLASVWYFWGCGSGVRLHSFGDWARDRGYEPGDVMPEQVGASGSSPAIDSLEGIGEFDWTTTPTTHLHLRENQISSIESGAFSGLTNLTDLRLNSRNTALTELNLAEVDFLSLSSFNVHGNRNITSVSLKNTVLNQTSLALLLDGGWQTGIGELESPFMSANGITKMDLSGIDFANITDLSVFYSCPYVDCEPPDCDYDCSPEYGRPI
jgi:hypothetical protein